VQKARERENKRKRKEEREKKKEEGAGREGVIERLKLSHGGPTYHSNVEKLKSGKVSVSSCRERRSADSHSKHLSAVQKG